MQSNNFLSAAGWTAPLEAATVRQEETKRAAENLHRAVSLCAAAEIMTSMASAGGATRGQMEGYWAAYARLESGVSLEDPELYEAVSGVRSALSAKLRQSGMSRELKTRLESPAPLLALSLYLGCDEGRLRAMNAVGDSFVISGEVSYA
ncbi:MAG: hypothetical protein LBH43_20860 [Treponema sp.]|jgi:hypothetical protein|nr:hypothetical protein [Treponema sp.]